MSINRDQLGNELTTLPQLELVPQYRGVWAAVSYEKSDMVIFNEGLYIANKNTTPYDVPGRTASWQPIVQVNPTINLPGLTSKVLTDNVSIQKINTNNLSTELVVNDPVDRVLLTNGAYENKAFGTVGEESLGPYVLNTTSTFTGDINPTDYTKRAITFQGGSPILRNLKVAWKTLTQRVVEGVVFHGPDSVKPEAIITPTVEHSSVEYAPGAGFIGFNAEHEKYLYSKAAHTMADAFHSSNGYNTLMLGNFAYDVGDDAFAFVDYNTRKAQIFGHIHANTLTEGQARGIVRGGSSHTTAMGNIINQARVAGIYTAMESAPEWTLRTPHHHINSGIIITKVGDVGWREASQTVRPTCLGGIYSEEEHTSIYSDIIVDRSEGSGAVFVHSTDIYLDNLVLKSCDKQGYFQQGGSVKAGRIIVDYTQGSGLYLDDGAVLDVDTLILKNTGVSSTDHNIIVIDDTSYLYCRNLIIEIDDPNASKAVMLYGGGRIDNVQWRTINNELSIYDKHKIIVNRQDVVVKAPPVPIALSYKSKAVGDKLKIPMMFKGRIIGISAQLDGGTYGTALVGCDIYKPQYADIRGVNMEMVGGGNDTFQSLVVNTPFVAGETIGFGWVQKFKQDGTDATEQPSAISVTLWVQKED